MSLHSKIQKLNIAKENLMETPTKVNSQLTHSAYVLVTQSCPTLCEPLECSPPGSSVRGIFQVRLLEWVAIYFSRGSSQFRD